jgi:Arc/MetJ-type ribon-helix-helix transcriptional regulator
MKLSISLPDEDIEFVDRLVSTRPSSNRSSILHAAIVALRDQHLAQEYRQAAAEWADGDGPAWEAVTGDGVG